ncbi:MAG: Flp pilus assembly protein CpaB [bacterium]
MSKTAAFFVLILAVLSGLIASATVMKYVKQHVQSQPKENLTTPIVMVNTEISAGSVIRAEQISLAKGDPNTVPEGAIVSEKDALGRVAKTTVYPGEILSANRLAAPGSPGGLPALIPTGDRAITLRVDDTISVAGFVRPGHHVDVLTTIDLPNSDHDTVSKTILQNIKVIATGQEIERNEENSKAKVVPTVTVLVTLQQAERLTLAANAGAIRLVLRNHIDTAEEITPGVTLTGLIPQANRAIQHEEPVAAQPPVPFQTKPRPVRIVQLYRGTEKTEVTFNH